MLQTQETNKDNPTLAWEYMTVTQHSIIKNWIEKKLLQLQKNVNYIMKIVCVTIQKGVTNTWSKLCGS
jgi:hypothetical protein